MATENVEDKKSIGEREKEIQDCRLPNQENFKYTRTKSFIIFRSKKKEKNVWDVIFGTLLIYFISARSHKKIEGKA